MEILYSLRINLNGSEEKLGKNKEWKNEIIKNLDSQPKFDYNRIDTLETKVKTMEIEIKRILGHLGMDTYREELRNRMGEVEKKED